MTYQKKKSVLPIYFIGFVWLLWALFGSLHRLTDFIMAALVSLAAYFLGKIIFPDRGYAMETEEKKEQAKAEPAKKEEKPKSTGNPEIDALIKERERAVSEMRRLNDSIKDIVRLEQVSQKIFDEVKRDPKKLPQIRRFMDYYLPTTLKLLNAYDRMDSTGASGANIDGTKGKIEDMLDTICKAFDKQLDALYGEEALDISTDITVMEQMLAGEGFGSTEEKTGDGGITLTL